MTTSPPSPCREAAATVAPRMPHSVTWRFGMKTPLKGKTLILTQFAMLLAIEAVVCFTPLGSLPAVGPIVATLGMVPVIITAILLGTGAGACMGAFAGLFSFLVWTFTPPNPLVAFVFTPFYMLGPTRGNVWSLVICFVPRILVGVVAGACFKLFTRLNWKSGVVYGIGGAAAYAVCRPIQKNMKHDIG